tara:strand:- start:587 stop:1003 length:417 start_codon:yes stop_codon:yes gene_type:complete
MAVKISTSARNAACDAVVGKIDGGSANSSGYIEIRTSPRAASPQAAASGTLLASLNFSNPAFQSSVNGVSKANTIADDSSIDATGVAAWFRFYDRDSNSVIDGTITIVGGGGDLEFNNIQFVKEGSAQVHEFSITMPE